MSNIVRIHKESAWCEADNEQSQMSKGKSKRENSPASQIIKALSKLHDGGVISVAITSLKDAELLRSSITTRARMVFNADQWDWHYVSKVVRVDGGGLKLKFQRRSGVSPRRLIEQRKKREREQQQRQYHDSNGRLGVPALPPLPQPQPQL